MNRWAKFSCISSGESCNPKYGRTVENYKYQFVGYFGRQAVDTPYAALQLYSVTVLDLKFCNNFFQLFFMPGVRPNGGSAPVSIPFQ
jgi:hypothetical protein